MIKMITENQAEQISEVFAKRYQEVAVEYSAQPFFF